MTGREIFEVWAPIGKRWVEWVRPVPFVAMKEHSKLYHFSEVAIPSIPYIDAAYKDAAVIVDLPGAESVKEGIALAKSGYRPIPVFNGTMEQPGARATVDNQSVGIALAWGAAELGRIDISDDALPAFLLDSNRTHRFKMDVSLFDNSWDIYYQDIPSAEYLLSQGIHRIIIVGERISRDLKKILYRFQKKGIRILLTKGYEMPRKVTVFRLLYNEID